MIDRWIDFFMSHIKNASSQTMAYVTKPNLTYMPHM